MHIRLLYCLAILSLVSFTYAQTDSEKQTIIDALDARSGTYTDMAHRIWDWAELGFQEDQSTELLQSKLRESGFRVESGVAGMPTSFVATYGSGEPVIGFLAEYDALPGVSQRAVPRPEKRAETNNGHACGHHLFGTDSVAAAVAVKNWMEQSGVQGTLLDYMKKGK